MVISEGEGVLLVQQSQGVMVMSEREGVLLGKQPQGVHGRGKLMSSLYNERKMVRDQLTKRLKTERTRELQTLST